MSEEQGDELVVEGAAVHNLKNLDVKIPRDKLTVITGLSGSGKSSLAFDTIYAEGQRRYIETFSSYARQFLGNLEKPDVDRITGLSPVISIEQKTISRNPRSTVGTITEVYDFLRLLYSKVATAYSYVTGKEMVQYNRRQIIELISSEYTEKQITLLAPVVKGRKGHYKELFVRLRKQGFSRVRIDGEVTEISLNMKLDRYKVHDIELVIDRIHVTEKSGTRLRESVDLALKRGKGSLFILDDSEKLKFFSQHLMCPDSGIAYDEPAPNYFSFNSPYGACQTCYGLGRITEIDQKKIFPDEKLSIRKGGIAPIRESNSTWLMNQLGELGKSFGFNLDTPIKDIPEDGRNAMIFGTEISDELSHLSSDEAVYKFEGIGRFIIRHFEENPSGGLSRWARSFLNYVPCPECGGARLRKEALHFKIDGKNIFDLSSMDLSQLDDWLKKLSGMLKERDLLIAGEILKELEKRMRILLEIGIDYLTLDRSAKTLSGGEAQRIRLATQIGSQLVGVLYILDEPSIGLHQRDNDMLINSLKELRDMGNSIIVVEHDKEIMMSADYLIDIGPGAGVHGGQIVAQGTPGEVLKNSTITSDYLSGRKEIDKPIKRRTSSIFLDLKGLTGNNLKKIDVSFPLGTFICVSGVSGSGKSTMVKETLYPYLMNHLHRGERPVKGLSKASGLDNIDKVIEIDQAPIGRTPRSNPATYTGMFTEIRSLFAMLPESKARGYKPGRFSFNVKGGRCEECQGAGVQTIEMNFLPDVYVECHQCNGRRYNRETLDIRYKGKSIGDVLEMTVEQAVDFFENIPGILRKIKTLKDVGLGYIHLGQPSTTLSGGEAQRIKLAAELSKRSTGKTFYILDEPTTGLHFEDIRVLLEVLQKIVDRGNTVLIIEHNLDVIKTADYIIDLGPEGGHKGGEIVTTGTPEQVAQSGIGFTSFYLNKELHTN